MNDLVKVAIKASKRAAKFIKESYGRVSSFQDKKPSDLKDFLTTVDVQVENLIIKEIHRSFPDHSILGEESGKIQRRDEYIWVIDPLDGTKNFIRGLGQFATSVGLMKKGQPYVGVLYDPLEELVFWAIRGEGAFMNGNRLYVTQTSELDSACLSLNLGKTRQIRRTSLAALKILSEYVPIIRIQGSTAYTIGQLVQGKFDGLIDNGEYWDWAAAIVVIQEAGGKVTTWEGKEITESSQFVLWSNGLLHDKLVERLSPIFGSF